MNDLIQLILTLSPKKLGLMIYLRHCLNDPLIRSIFEASDKNLAKIKVDQSYPDPIESAIKCFHRDIAETSDSDVTEEFRLPLTIQLFLANEYKKDFPALLTNIIYLLELYEKYHFGYADNALTSLKCALETAIEEQVTGQLEMKDDPIISKAVDALQKKYLAEDKQDIINKKNDANIMLETYALAVKNKIIIERVNLFCEFRNEFDLIFFAINTFAINDEMQEKIAPIKKTLLILYDCMFDHEKNAVERLDCFYKLFVAQKCHIKSTDIERVDKTVEIFLTKISDLLEENKHLISKNSWQLFGLFGYVASFVQPTQATTAVVATVYKSTHAGL